MPEFSITTDLLQKDFEIVKTIAKGAFGEVYKVQKLSENKEYALKVLNKSQVSIYYYHIVYEKKNLFFFFLLMLTF